MFGSMTEFDLEALEAGPPLVFIVGNGSTGVPPERIAERLGAKPQTPPGRQIIT